MKVGRLRELMLRYQYFIFDCDGVIFHGKEVLGDSLRVLDLLYSNGKRVYVYSNNSKRGTRELVQRFADVGYHIPAQSVITTPYLSAHYLQQSSLHTVYLLGNTTFHNELARHGINVAHVSVHNLHKPATYAGIQAVVSGCDPAFSYDKLACAGHLAKMGRLFILADLDSFYKMGGFKMPAAAFTFYPIQLLSGLIPTTICKPAPYALQFLMRRDGIATAEQKQFLMVGDSLETDIQFGLNADIDTLLVLSGVTSQHTLAHSTIKPNYVMNALTLD